MVNFAYDLQIVIAGFKDFLHACLTEMLGQDFWTRYSRKEALSHLFNTDSFWEIGLVPENMVMVAIDMYEKSLRE